MTAAERLLEAFAFYGIDPDSYGETLAGGKTCTCCRLHTENRPRPTCDLEKARLADMEALGFDGRTCLHCRQVYPAIIDRGAICPACSRASALRTTEAWAAVRRRRRERSGLTLRIDDGRGCSERVPAWTLDPEYGRPT